MKLFGQSVLGPNVDYLVFPRAEYDIIITAQAILDDTPFTDMCPRPKPPKKHRAGQSQWEEDINDDDYKKAIDTWASRKSAWTILESLKATPKETLEWEMVKPNEPATWPLWQEEMKAAFFTDQEIINVMSLVWGVNGMNQSKLDEARLRFLAGQARMYKAPLSQTDEAKNTPSGEPVNDLESVPQA